MAGDRVITLRFKPESVPDMELYRELEAEKNRLGLSMPVYVKGILGRHFEGMGGGWKDAGTDGCMEQIREIVHGEIAAHSAAVTGTLERIAEGLPNGIGNVIQERLPGSEEALPEYSGDFPEGLNGVLEKFL